MCIAVSACGWSCERAFRLSALFASRCGVTSLKKTLLRNAPNVPSLVAWRDMVFKLFVFHLRVFLRAKDEGIFTVGCDSSQRVYKEKPIYGGRTNNENDNGE